MGGVHPVQAAAAFGLGGGARKRTAPPLTVRAAAAARGGPLAAAAGRAPPNGAVAAAIVHHYDFIGEPGSLREGRWERERTGERVKAQETQGERACGVQQGGLWGFAERATQTLRRQPGPESWPSLSCLPSAPPKIEETRKQGKIEGKATGLPVPPPRQVGQRLLKRSRQALLFIVGWGEGGDSVGVAIAAG